MKEEKALDIILKAISDRQPITLVDLGQVLSDFGFKSSQIELQRYLTHLMKAGDIESLTTKLTGFPSIYVITVKGRKILESGGYSPNFIQRITRWTKSDSGYGNAKWIVTIILTFTSIVLSIVALLAK